MKDSQIPSTNFEGSRCHCPSWQYGCHIAMPSTRSVKTQTDPVVMSTMRYLIDAAINTDYIVVSLNIHHDHGYAKFSSQSCMTSPTDHGSPVNVDDTSDVLVSLSPFSFQVRRKTLKRMMQNIW